MIAMKILIFILEFILIFSTSYLLYLGIVTLITSFNTRTLKQKVKKEREALQKELDDLDRQAYKAFNDMLKESMEVAKEDYQKQRAGFTDSPPPRKDVEPL